MAKKIGTVDAISGAAGILSNSIGNLTNTFEYTPSYKQSSGPLGYQEEQKIDTAGVGPSVGSVGGAAAQGAMSGAALGPLGMVGGALVGGLTSFLGSSNKKKQMEAENKRIENRNLYRKAGAETTKLQNDFNTENTNKDMTYMKHGGEFKKASLRKPNARVDEGETIMSQGGEMQTVENSNPNTTEVQPNTTDGYVTALKDGDKVLSNKIFIPGTKITFADEGRKLEDKMSKIKDGKYNTNVGRNTADLNHSNLMKQYNALFAKQEALKPKESLSEVSAAVMADGGMYTAPQVQSRKFTRDFTMINSLKSPRDLSFLPNNTIPGFDDGGMYMIGDGYQNLQQLAKGGSPVVQRDPSTLKHGMDYNLNGFDAFADGGDYQEDPAAYTTDAYRLKRIQEIGENNKGTSILNSLGTLAPSLYNLGQGVFGKTDKMKSVSADDFTAYNPYESQALSTLAKRIVNVQPMLQKNAENAAIARYNARQAGIGGRSYDLASTTGRMKADQDVMSNAQQLSNQYLGDYANMLSNMGVQRASQLSNAKQAAFNANLGIRDYNAKADAAKQNMLTTGLSDIGKYGQMLGINKNKAAYDKQLLDMMTKYYGNYMTPGAFNFQMNK